MPSWASVELEHHLEVYPTGFPNGLRVATVLLSIRVGLSWALQHEGHTNIMNMSKDRQQHSTLIHVWKSQGKLVCLGLRVLAFLGRGLGEQRRYLNYHIGL